MTTALLALGQRCVATELAQERGPFTARLVLTPTPAVSTHLKDPIELPLSGALLVMLSVEGPAPLDVEMPPELTLSPGWDLRPSTQPLLAAAGEGRCRWQQTFRLEPRQPGDLPLLVGSFRAKSQSEPPAEVVFDWQPLTIRVTTSVPQADLGLLRDQLEPEMPPAPEVVASSWLWALLCLLIVLALGLLWWQRRRNETVLFVSPEQWALTELERIASLQLPNRGNGSELHVLLSDVVRRYLELRHALPASRWTTPEFLAAMRESPQLSEKQRDLLGEFLTQCDLVKFAHATPSPEQCQQALEVARQLVQTALPHPHS